jgi:hypothetical protein
MLYDKRWEKPEIKPDVFSLQGLIYWLEMQPANIAYDWDDIHGCLACKYLQAVKGWEVPAGETNLGSVFEDLDQYHDVCAVRPWTFGAALERARAIARTS